MSKQNHNIPKDYKGTPATGEQPLAGAIIGDGKSAKPVAKQKKEPVVATTGAVVSNTQDSSLSKKSRIIIFGLLGVLVLVSASWLIARNTPVATIFVSKNCVGDKELIGLYNKATTKISDKAEYEVIMRAIQKKAKFKEDIVCQYMAFDSAKRIGDEPGALAAYAQLKLLSESGKTMPQGLITNAEEVKSILEQYQYYDKTRTGQDGIG